MESFFLLCFIDLHFFSDISVILFLASGTILVEGILTKNRSLTVSDFGTLCLGAF